MKIKTFNQLLYSLSLILMLGYSIESAAQISGQVVYKRTIALGTGDHFYYDTLKFSGSKLLYIEKREGQQWWTEEKYRITIHPEDRIRFLDMNTLECTDQQFDFDQKKHELRKTKSKAINWTIHNEFKTIGKFRVQKATADYYMKDKLMYGSGITTAWFATDVPIGVGPDFMWGLPGLIIEMKTHGQMLGQYQLESIEYLPVNISVPNKGKLVNAENVSNTTAKLQKLMDKN
jgi:GLPGLI family protein